MSLSLQLSLTLTWEAQQKEGEEVKESESGRKIKPDRNSSRNCKDGGEGKVDSEEQDRRIVLTRTIGLIKYRNISCVHTLFIQVSFK